MILDGGIDNNFDKHCDRCGWFVDFLNRHRLRMLGSEVTGYLGDLVDQAFNAYLDDMSTDDLCHRHYESNPYIDGSLSDEEKKMIYVYSQNDNSPLGKQELISYLRSDVGRKRTPGRILDAIMKMNGTITKFKLKTPLVTFRGTNTTSGSPYHLFFDGAYQKIQKTREPMEYEDNGFVSTTKRYQTALNYAEKEERDVEIRFAYYVSKGVGAMPMDHEYGVAKYQDDREILLGAYGKYLITDIDKRKEGNKTIYYALIVAME